MVIQLKCNTTLFFIFDFSTVLGKINYYSTLFLPGFIAALSVLIESEENRKLDTLIFFNSVSICSLMEY